MTYHFTCGGQDSVSGPRCQSPHFSGREVCFDEADISQQFSVLTLQARDHLQGKCSILCYVKVLRKSHVCRKRNSNRPFPSCFEPHCKIEATCKVLIMKISFHSYANKTNFHMKRFAFSLAFIMRFTATWKCPISYPESSGFLVSGATPGRLWGHRKNSIFLIGCSVTVSIVLPQKSCGNKIRCPQSLPGVAPLTKKPENSGYEIGKFCPLEVT